MFTRFVRLALRFVAGAAFIVGSATFFLTAIVVPPQIHTLRTRPVPVYPVQSFSAEPTFDAPVIYTPDPYKVVMPPTPTPLPTATMSSAAPTVRKSVQAASKAVKPTYIAPASVAQAYAATRVGSGQFSCLRSLWNRESGWNVHADNPDSGAYGIPQSLPGSKMAAFGSNWRDDYKTQINWGLDYISAVYGTPCAAWQHSEDYGWY